MSVFCIFAENIFDHSSSRLPQIYCTIYLLFYRIGFTFGVALLIYPSIQGYNRIFKPIFTHPIFNILGKLTYGCYLIHVLVFQTLLAKVMNNRYFNFWIYLMDIIFGFGFAYLFSFVAGLLFETPIAQISKTLISQLSITQGKTEKIQKVNNNDLKDA